MQLAEHERSVLGAILLDNTALDRVELEPSDFETGRYSSIYKSIIAVVNRGDVADYLSVLDDLERRKVSGACGAWFADLEMPTAGNITFYANKVRSASQSRQLRYIAAKAVENIDGGADPADVLEEMESAITGLTVGRNEARLLHEIYPAAVERIEALYHAQDGITGVPTGFADLDKLLLGFQNDDLIILAARASIGKTALALQMATSVWFDSKTPVGFFSCEMSAEALLIRMLSSRMRIDHHRIRSGFMRPSEFDKIVEFGGEIQDARYWIDDTPSIRLQDLRSSARKMARQGAKALFVDYLTLIRHGRPNTPRHERVGEISKSLKNLARELHIPVIALSQLGRDAEGTRPTIANLRQSGEIEEDADVVILMNRERENKTDGMQEVELIIAKHRNGPTDSITVMLDPKYTRFENAAK